MKPGESFVGQPVRSLQTMLRILSEDDPRQPTVVPDGVYGPTTSQAVAAFQRRKGLPANGIADQQTWDAIVFDYEQALIRITKAEPIEILLEPGQILKRGDVNPYILLLQAMLAQLSKDHTMITPASHSGIFDDSTVIALTDFQRLSALPETGDLDRITWKHLVHQFTLNAHTNALRAPKQETI